MCDFISTYFIHDIGYPKNFKTIGCSDENIEKTRNVSETLLMPTGCFFLSKLTKDEEK